MIRASDPDEMTPAARLAAVAELLAAGHVRAIARRRADSAQQATGGLAGVGEVEAPCATPMNRPTTAEHTRP